MPALRASPPLLPGAAAASGLPPSPPIPGCRPPQGPSPAVQALRQYEKHHSDAALQGVLRLVEEGTHGSAACMAAVKARFLIPQGHLVHDCEARSSTWALLPAFHCISFSGFPAPPCPLLLQALLLHAAQAAERQRGPEGEAAVAHLLQQALEAAAHGALRYRSIQLLVRQGRAWEWDHFIPCLCGTLAAARAPEMQRPGASITRASHARRPPQEAFCHLMHAAHGNKHQVERRCGVLELLQYGADMRRRASEGLESSPLLPVEQLLADKGTPRHMSWWDSVPFADWVHPAAEAVGNST